MPRPSPHAAGASAPPARGLEGSPIEELRKTLYDSYRETHHAYGQRDEEVRDRQVGDLSALLARHLDLRGIRTALDLGCGEGLMLEAMTRQGIPSLSGVDLSPQMLGEARRRTDARLSLENAQDHLEQLAPESLDLVTAIDFIEHLTREEAAALARGIFRVLKPGGALLLRCPNGGSPLHGRMHFGDLTHERAYTPNALGQLLRPAGFADLKVFEERPRPKSAKTALRAALWQAVHLFTALRIAVETGRLRGHVLTLNLIATARRPAD